MCLNAHLIFDRTKSPAKEEKSASPQRKFSSDPHNITSFHKYSSEKNGDKSDCRKKATETEFSLLDLLGEDGSNGKEEGSPVHECHVAFSVEGKTRLEPSVHSPQQQCRFSSAPKGAKRHPPSNKYKMNESKQNAVLYDIDVPTSHSTFDLPSNSRDIRDDHGNTRSNNLFGNSCKPLDDLDFKSDSLFTEGCSNNNLEDMSESPWNAKSEFQDDDSTDEKMLDASTTTIVSADFFRENMNGMHAFAFEDPYLQKREKSYNMHAFAFEDPYLQERLPIKNMSLFPFTKLIFFVSISELLFC
ncbi:hypothetical protein MKX03_019863 [Papaver bracteatum]|nr:hypothetical protein MKX03_019863 [Papaver bracteatum]